MRYLKNVATLAFDADRCSGCRMCARVCPHGVFSVEDGKARVVDRDACMECGACSLNCPEGALSVNAGVGCAAAVISGFVRGTEPSCCCRQDEGRPSQHTPANKP